MVGVAGRNQDREVRLPAESVVERGKEVGGRFVGKGPTCTTKSMYSSGTAPPLAMGVK